MYKTTIIDCSSITLYFNSAFLIHSKTLIFVSIPFIFSSYFIFPFCFFILFFLFLL